MTTSVLLAAADAEHFDRTVATPVDAGERDGAPLALADREAVRVWGVPQGTRNERVFERMAVGDLLLFRRDGEYVGVGTVGETFEDAKGWIADTF